MDKNIKNFEDYLKENWDNVEEFITEDDDVEKEIIKADEEANKEQAIQSATIAQTEEEPTEPSEDVKPEEPNVEDIGTTLSSKPASCGCKYVILNGVVSNINSDNAAIQISKIYKEKLGNCHEIKLFQLNIQPVSEGLEEPMDGMVQVYDALAGVDVIVLVSDLKKGQLSSVLQTAMERLANHYKHKELRNVIFSSLITGAEDAHQSVKSHLLNFANNMGMIVGGDCHVFCCIEEGEKLGDCDHNFDADTTTASTCVKQLCCTTKPIRSDVVSVEEDKPKTTGSLPALSDVVDDAANTIKDTIKTFDEFADGMDNPPVDNGLETEPTPAIEEEEEEAEPVSPADDESYDYVNEIPYNPLETPMSRPNHDVALELPDSEKEKKTDRESIEMNETSSSIFDFEQFIIESESENKDWIIRFYDENDNEIDSFIIKDRRENEAHKEAEAEVERRSDVEDWTMTPKKKKKKK